MLIISKEESLDPSPGEGNIGFSVGSSKYPDKSMFIYVVFSI